MLVIRDAQLRILAEQLDARFFRSLVEWARSAWWEQTMGRSQDDLDRWMRAIAARATGFGVRREDDVRAFVELEMGLGPCFERKMSFAMAVLGDPALSGGAKMALLRQRTSTP